MVSQDAQAGAASKWMQEEDLLLLDRGISSRDMSDMSDTVLLLCHVDRVRLNRSKVL